MATYQIIHFDGVVLPAYNPEQDLSVAPVDSTLLPSIGSVFDYYGSRRRMPIRQQIVIKGIYAGESSYLIDHTGAFIVDHLGNRILVAEATGNLRNQVEVFRAKVGVRGYLWRKRWTGEAFYQWRTARLLNVQERTDLRHRTVLAELECTFETAQGAWRASPATTATAALPGGEVNFPVNNHNTMVVDDAVLTIQASTGTITNITIVNAAVGISLIWAGSLTSGTSLIIDAGAQTVRAGGADLYAGFSLAAGHTARGWLPLSPGVNTLVVTTAGAAGNASITFFGQDL